MIKLEKVSFSHCTYLHDALHLHHLLIRDPVFQTDADISASSGPKQRELKPWTPGPEDNSPVQRNKVNGGSHREAETFGPVSTGSWDQFETNKRLFGTETTWDENIYTTKLDKSAPDYKQQEERATRLAREIMDVSPQNQSGGWRK